MAVSDLYFRQIPVGMMANFSYLIGDLKTKECVVVDPAWEVEAVIKRAKDEGMKIIAGILTHTHFDHANNVEKLVKLTNAKIYVHKNEAKEISAVKENIIETDEGFILNVGSLSFKFLHTPGHTKGSQCVAVEDRLITGDTLFVGACGRCDLPGGSEREMSQSLKRLASLDGKLKVFAGHAYGDSDFSTIDREKRMNPYMRFR